MHAAGLLVDAQAFAERARERVRQCRPAVPIETAHPLQVSREVTFVHEPRNDSLLEPRISCMEGARSAREGFHEPVGDDHVAQPQSREQNLAEAAGIEYDVRTVE